MANGDEQQKKVQAPADGGAVRATAQALELEREKLALERKKVELEEIKVELEKVKTRWTAIAVTVPLLAAILTVAFGFWSNNEQSRHQFELKAAEIVMQSETPYEAQARARAFVEMFPGHFSANFAEAFRPEQYADLHDSEKLALLDLLRDKLTKEEMRRAWIHLFPLDEWAREIPLGATPHASAKPGARPASR